jgi:hypothetical protein
MPMVWAFPVVFLILWLPGFSFHFGGKVMHRMVILAVIIRLNRLIIDTI